MTNEQFLACLNKNVQRVRKYCPGMDGTDGLCDCIGLIIGAVRLAGGTWKGTHGSNWAARNEMKSLEKIRGAGVLQPGDMVFKAREPGEEDYSLPSAYQNHPDRRDYYHVGVVTGTAPLEITHCTSVSGGIRRDGTLGKWQYFGKCRKITEANVNETKQYRVTGGTLKMRTGPGTEYPVLARIPDGETLASASAPENGWVKVQWQGREGFCMAKYLSHAGTLPELNRLQALLQEAAALVDVLVGTGEAGE